MAPGGRFAEADPNISNPNSSPVHRLPATNNPNARVVAQVPSAFPCTLPPSTSEPYARGLASSYTSQYPGSTSYTWNSVERRTPSLTGAFGSVLAGAVGATNYSLLTDGAGPTSYSRRHSMPLPYQYPQTAPYNPHSTSLSILPTRAGALGSATNPTMSREGRSSRSDTSRHHADTSMRSGSQSRPSQTSRRSSLHTPCRNIPPRAMSFNFAPSNMQPATHTQQAASSTMFSPTAGDSPSLPAIQEDVEMGSPDRLLRASDYVVQNSRGGVAQTHVGSSGGGTTYNALDHNADGAEVPRIGLAQVHLPTGSANVMQNHGNADPPIPQGRLDVPQLHGTEFAPSAGSSSGRPQASGVHSNDHGTVSGSFSSIGLRVTHTYQVCARVQR